MKNVFISALVPAVVPAGIPRWSLRHYRGVTPVVPRWYRGGPAAGGPSVSGPRGLREGDHVYSDGVPDKIDPCVCSPPD